MKNKVIISCAVTGSAHTPTMSDALPVTPQEIADQSIAAAKAGAAILHLHARVPEDGRPTGDPDIYAQFLPVIRQATDAVVNITTGGSRDDECGRPAGGGAALPTRNVFAQHGLDQLRILSCGQAYRDVEA